MRIEQVYCQNYKSMQDARLEDLQALNILIGKNNSGKSNLLKAIKAFFDFLSPSMLVSILSTAEVRQALFRSGDGVTSEEAKITVTLALEDSEILQLVADISSEAPQVKNALADLKSRTLLQVATKICMEPSMAYVESIHLVDNANRENRTVILYVPDGLAPELHVRARELVQFDRENLALEEIRLNLDELYLRPTTRDDSYRTRTFLRRYRIRPEVREEVMRIIESSREINATRQSLSELIAQRNELAETLRASRLTAELTTFAGAEDGIPSYVINLLERITAWKVLYLDETRQPVGVEEARRLLSLKMRRGGDVNLRAIKSAVSSLLNVQIDAFESSARMSENRPLAEMDVDDFLVELNGSGIRESLRLILDVNFEDPDSLLLEEPEVHLHPALEYSLLQYLKGQSEHRQIFITTHSTNFLDTAGESKIYLVSKDSQTRVAAMDMEELGERIPRELGIRLSSVFMFDRLVFVEGASDELVLRELASKLDLNLAIAGVGFVQTNGARSFSYFANAITLDVLSKRRVEAIFLIDRDERSEEEVTAMKRLCQDKAELHVWQKREIENYLLDPDAIAMLINSKSDGRQSPSVDTIRDMLDNAVKELQDSTIVRRFLHKTCRSLYFDRERLKPLGPEAILEGVKSQIENMVATVRDIETNLLGDFEAAKLAVTDKWDASAIDIVPGSTVIDSVLQKYGLRYHKTKDAARLAKFLTNNRIDREIQKVLNQIVGN